MEKKMETTIVYRGYIGIMEKKMDTLGPFKGTYRVILGLYWGMFGLYSWSGSATRC